VTDFLYSIALTLLAVVLGYPVLRAACRALNDISEHRPLPRPFWTREAPTNTIIKPIRPPFYDQDKDTT